MLLIILCFLCGAVLSVRFDFLILLPALLMCWVVALVTGVFLQWSWSALIQELVGVTVALQAGYLAGILGQCALQWKHAPSVKSAEGGEAIAVPGSNKA